MKPFETIRFYNVVTLFIPLLVFCSYFREYLKVFDYSLIDILVFSHNKVYFYIAAMAFFGFIKVYVIWVLTGKEKVNDLDFVEEERRKIIEERRRLIQDRRQRLVEREAVVISFKEDQSGGLQGFDGIRLFKDISW
jgi:putative heme iron utilization protein